MSKGPKKKKADTDVFSLTINNEAFKLRLIGGLLMGLDPMSVELEHNEIHALGCMITDISDNMRDWNAGQY